MEIDWKKIDERTYKAGFRKMINRKYELPDGTTADYDIVVAGPDVTVLALTKDNKVILEKVYRPGPDKILTELPGGFCDANLTPKDAIKAELLEETGYTGDFELVGQTYADAYSTMQSYHFIARNCEKVQEPVTEEDEFMEIIFLSIIDFKIFLKSGDLTRPETAYIGLNALQL